MVSQTSLRSSACLDMIVMTRASIFQFSFVFVALKNIVSSDEYSILRIYGDAVEYLEYIFNILYVFIHFCSFYGFLHSFFMKCAKMRPDQHSWGLPD